MTRYLRRARDHPLVNSGEIARRVRSDG